MINYNLDGSLCNQPSTSDRVGFTYGGMDFTSQKDYPTKDSVKQLTFKQFLPGFILQFSPLLFLLFI